MLYAKSEKSVGIQRKDDYKDDMLTPLEIEMKLRGLSKQTSKMYLYYNSKFLDYINKEEVT